MHGVAFQAVGVCRSHHIAPDACSTEDNCIVFGNAQDIRVSTLCGHISDIGETVSVLIVAFGTLGFVEHFDAVIMIPVAGNDHLAAVELEG